MTDTSENKVKFRHEFKYLCTDAQLSILESRLKVSFPRTNMLVQMVSIG